MELSRVDKLLLGELAAGLPRVSRPFAEIGARVGLTETAVIDRVEQLVSAGIVSRFGVVVRHHELGYRANAMVVWDTPDEMVDRAAAALAALPFVTLCYRRPRCPPDWPYNLFCMIHGRSRARVERLASEAGEAAGLADRPNAILFSRRRFKQSGARFDVRPIVAEAAQ